MKKENGFTLVEILVAIGLLGAIVVAFLGALCGGSKAIIVADEHATAESLARSQMEYVKKQSYDADWNYTVSILQRSSSDQPSWWDDGNPALLSSNYDDYEVTIVASELQPGLQKITITISHNGDPVYTAGNYTLEGYKGKR